MKPSQAMWIAVTCLLLFLAAGPAMAQLPRQISYQGMLTDDNGDPVDGSYSMTFAIYDAATGGSVLWNETQTVSVTGGVYNVTLGQPGNEIDPADMDGDRFFGVRVEIDAEMTPRQPITATAFSLRSALADDADTLTGNSLTDLDGRYVQQGETGAVDSNMITDGSVTSDDLGADSVNAGEIAAGAVRSSEVANNSLTAADLAIDSVTASEIAAGAVGSNEIADGSVTAADLADGAALAEILDDDGPGSGLNADRLDGLSSGSFMSAGTDNWVDVTGDTMTGVLSVPLLRIDGTTVLVADEDNNTFVGFRAGQANAGGTRNTFLGSGAGTANTTRTRNSFLGYLAGHENTEGVDNTFIGYSSGYNNTTADDNVFVGFWSGYLNTTGSSNTYIGTSAGRYNTTGESNTYIGKSAGYFNSTGSQNTFIGRSAGSVNTEGYGNTFIGCSAGSGNSTGNSNTFFGRDAGYSNNTGFDNTFQGNDAGRSNTTGDRNTFLGASAGQGNISGGYNTFVGGGTGYNSSSGSNNTLVGYNAGLNLAGSDNVFVGYYAGSNETGSDKLYIDNSSTSAPLIWGDFSTNVATVNGRLGVGIAPDSAYQFHSLEATAGGRAVYGQSTGTAAIGVWGHATGSSSTGVWGTGVLYDFYASGPGQNYAASSSIRWKENIRDIEGALDMVLNMRGVYFDWDADHGGQHDLGFIAEEVGAYVPEVVGFEPDSDYASGMDYGKMTPILLQAIKEQQAMIAALRSEMASLKAEMAVMNAAR